MGIDAGAAAALSALAAALGATIYLVVGARSRRGIATPNQRATYEVLHRAGLAAEPLRAGLDAASAAKAIPHLHALVGGVALGLADAHRVLRPTRAPATITASSSTPRPAGSLARPHGDLRGRDLPCDEVDCPSGARS